MPEVPQRPNEWYVNIPFSDLNKLVNHLGELDSMREANAQLHREVEGLRNLYSELLVAFGELRREIRKR